MGYIIAYFEFWTILGTSVSLATKKVIKQIGIYEKYYPQKYIMPNRTIRKIFGLKKQEIPKWWYPHLLMSFVYPTLFIITTGIYFIFLKSPFILEIIGVFGWIYECVFSIDAVHIMIGVFIYRKRL